MKFISKLLFPGRDKWIVSYLLFCPCFSYIHLVCWVVSFILYSFSMLSRFIYIIHEIRDNDFNFEIIVSISLYNSLSHNWSIKSKQEQVIMVIMILKLWKMILRILKLLFQLLMNLVQNSISIIEKCVSIAYGIGFFSELAYVIGDFFIVRHCFLYCF